MNVRIVPAGGDLIEEVMTHLEGTERDYSADLVVFPGKRPSHFLRKALAEKIRTGFIPPGICSMDELADRIYEEAAQARKLETIDAVAILYDLHRKAPDPVGGDGFMSPDRFFPLGLKIYRDIEELTIEEVNPHFVQEVEPLIEEGLPEQSRRRLQSLAFFYREFYKEIAARGLSTRALRYRSAAGRVLDSSIISLRRVVFAGFFGLTKAEQRLFKELLPSGNCRFIFQKGPGLRLTLEGLGISMPEEADGPAHLPKLHFYSSPDTHGQVFGLARILREQEEEGRVPDTRSAIVLPASETLFPLLRQGLPAMPADSFNISLGYPLHRTPVFGFLNNLMELVTSMDRDRVYIPDYLKFVLHPYTKNIYFDGRAEITRILFHTIEEGLTRKRSRTFLTLAEIEGDEQMLGEVLTRLPHDDQAGQEGITKKALADHLREIHLSTIGRFTAFRDLSDFAQQCSGVLLYIFNQSTARLHPLYHPFSEAFIKALDLLPRSLMQDFAFEEKSSYFGFFRKYVMTCHVPFSGTPVRGLQVLGALETRNLKFDSVFILDANEEVLPDTKKEDSLLPFKARQTLGLPTYIDRDRLAAYYFETLLQGASEAHIFFVENNQKERSRFVERLLWESQKRDGTTDQKKYVQTMQYKVSLVNRSPEPQPKTEEVSAFLKDHAYSASALNQYLRCPLQFYYATVLRLGRKETMTGDIERTDLGTFVHHVLAAYFAKRRGRPLTERDMDVKEMEALVDERFSSMYGPEPAGALYLLKRQAGRHLADLLTDYYIPLLREKSVTVLAGEEPLEAVLEGFRLKGRPDSIEQRDGRTVVIDYKTGSNKKYLEIDLDGLDPDDRGSWNRAIGSIQLPFYLLLYSLNKGRQVQALNALFLMLGRAKISRDIELPLFNDAADVDLEPLREVILRLLREITDPGQPFLPAPDMKKACPPCDFQYICGTQWIVA
ncbi:MAG: PD-(D/E)XK nuclease family protein [Nitrospirae bacterium]|nr:MAG: PD-(D/E)XK nuclease family protein [Nitrospirota bacterium]